eukprot:TRINITY_DN7598_c0_g1_i7.p1 TRINITY_DN7598_c0_g1~~TRINITY_DN7598_c0_g1_i7.p1  ORF type:complete len:223 (-),score=5.82 TRINITY_DN7598_c0_g1_i7:64-696(-)
MEEDIEILFRQFYNPIAKVMRNISLKTLECKIHSRQLKYLQYSSSSVVKQRREYSGRERRKERADYKPEIEPVKLDKTFVRQGTPPEEVLDRAKLQKLSFKPISDFNIAYVSRKFIPGLLTHWSYISKSVEQYQRFQQIFEPIMKSKDIQIMRYDKQRSQLFGLFDLLEYKRSKSRMEDSRNIREQSNQYMLANQWRAKKVLQGRRQRFS